MAHELSGRHMIGDLRSVLIRLLRTPIIMHLPSVLVGSAAAGGGFLLIHRELSHRERLSKKWLLREKIEKEVSNMWKEARKSISGETPTSAKGGNQVQETVEKTVEKTWNDGVDSIRKFF